MRTPLTLIMILIFISQLNAAENLKVELYKDGYSVSLNSYLQTYLYGNAVGYLSTCRHLEKVTGKPVNKLSTVKVLDKIKSGNHLKVTFSKDSPKLPIADTYEVVDEIYIGFDDRGSPGIITLNEDKIQLYSKCSGAVSITNFSCNQVLSELLNINIDSDRCNFFMNNLN